MNPKYLQAEAAAETLNSLTPSADKEKSPKPALAGFHDRPDAVANRQKNLILVIDDDAAVRESTLRILEKAGFRALSGATAAEAVSLTRSHRPVLVLLDVVLPDGSGVDTAQIIKRDPELAGVFIILLSGFRISPEEQAEGLSKGMADGYITRPFSQAEFLARIDAFLRIRATQEALREKGDEMERLIYRVSHDLKSPHVTMGAFLDYLEKDMAAGDSERIQKDLFYMRSAAGRMGKLLDELQELSRVGRTEAPAVSVSFLDLVTDALNAVAGRIALQQAVVRISDDGILLQGDRFRLSEIWQNLVENALKYMGDQPSPCIEIGLKPHGWETVFFVRDNGMGIDPESHKKIFELFEKLDSRSDGTGMGLALVKRIVEKYRGRIWVESEGAGKGSCFRFTLPGCGT